MKKLLAVAAILITGALYASSHYIHNYKKINEWEDQYGTVHCQWECDPINAQSHTKRTKGYGQCPRPY